MLLALRSNRLIKDYAETGRLGPPPSPCATSSQCWAAMARCRRQTSVDPTISVMAGMHKANFPDEGRLEADEQIVDPARERAPELGGWRPRGAGAVGEDWGILQVSGKRCLQ
jgi:hypothetical protein